MYFAPWDRHYDEGMHAAKEQVAKMLRKARETE